MKLIELPNQDPKSFEFAAFKWLVKRFARPSRSLCVGLTPMGGLCAITFDGVVQDSAPDIITLCVRVQQRNLK